MAMDSFASVYEHILQNPAPLEPPGKPTSKQLTAKISALSVHPTLEAALHILNNDLPAAHFLVRHMQSSPAFEGMFLHGILHRIEGDYDNARAWYSNVKDSEVFTHTWPKGGEDEARKMIDHIEAFVRRKQGHETDLRAASLREIEAVVEFCRRKFGDAAISDASDAFVQNDDRIKQMSQDMITGGEGYRKF